MLYGAIVKKRIRQAFDQVNNRRWDELMELDHARAFITASAASMRSAVSATTERLCACGSSAWRASCPISSSKINDIWVKGPPWHTMVFVQWDGTATLLDGGGYFQHAIHVITLRWGKIAALDVFEDSQEVARALAVQAAAGLDEAVAEPILS